MDDHFPQTRASAEHLGKLLGGHLRQQQIVIATIADTSAHLTLGFCVANGPRGVMRVVGIPYGAVVPGMRVYARETGLHRWLFQGFAPAPRVGLRSGALQAITPALGASGPYAVATTPLALPVATSSGYFWACFLYVPAIPSAAITIWDWRLDDASQTAGLQAIYLPTGQIRLQSYGATVATTTSTTTFAPHRVWWLVWQLGNNATTLMANGTSIACTGVPVAWPSVTGHYWGTWLSAYSGAAGAPLGTWVSKMLFGYAVTPQGPLPPITDIPTTDSAIPLGGAPLNNGVTTLSCLLCGDDVAGALLHDSAVTGGATFAVTPGLAAIVPIGPY